MVMNGWRRHLPRSEDVTIDKYNTFITYVINSFTAAQKRVQNTVKTRYSGMAKLDKLHYSGLTKTPYIFDKFI